MIYRMYIPCVKILLIWRNKDYLIFIIIIIMNISPRKLIQEPQMQLQLIWFEQSHLSSPPNVSLKFFIAFLYIRPAWATKSKYYRH